MKLALISESAPDLAPLEARQRQGGADDSQPSAALLVGRAGPGVNPSPRPVRMEALPVRDHCGARSGKGAASGESRTVRKRLLLADDLPSIRDSLGRLLRRQGYEVVLARNGHEAVERVASESFDLVLLDLSMPGMDGWQALSRVAALKPGLPAVVITAHSHQRPWVEPAGAWALLEKPLDIPLLLAVVAELLGRSAHHQRVAGEARFRHYGPNQNFPGLLARSGINE